MRVSARNTQKIAKIVIWSAALLVIVLLLAIMIYILLKGIPATQLAIPIGDSAGYGTLRRYSLHHCRHSAGDSSSHLCSNTTWSRDGFLPHRVHSVRAESLGSSASVRSRWQGYPPLYTGFLASSSLSYISNLGWSILSGGLTLAVMILPTIIRTSEEAIRTVPSHVSRSQLLSGRH